MTLPIFLNLQIYAVVVNWNRPADTVACIDSLLAQASITPKVIVVDNGSTDDSVSIIREKFPQVELIASPTNLKFAGGYNLGIRRALESGADAVFILNNDAVIAPNGLATMLLQTAPDVGVVAPMIYRFDHPQRIWSIGGRINLWTLEKSDDARNEDDPDEWPSVIEQDFVTGCSMLFSRKVIEEVGLFDENFEQYYEDMDLCRRIRLAHFRILVIPKAKVWHKIALSSGGSDAPEERYWMARSSVRYFRKHANGHQLLVIIPYRLGSAIKTTLRLIIKKRWASVWAYWKGLMEGFHDNVHLVSKR
jgi:GT2 family glycosyltransferase